MLRFLYFNVLNSSIDHLHLYYPLNFNSFHFKSGNCSHVPGVVGLEHNYIRPAGTHGSGIPTELIIIT